MNQEKDVLAERVKGLMKVGLNETAEMLKLVRGVEDVVDLGYGDPYYTTPAHIMEPNGRWKKVIPTMFYRWKVTLP